MSESYIEKIARHLRNRKILKEVLSAPFRRTEIINWLIEHNGYKKYLEIGIGACKNHRRITAEYKETVDVFSAPPEGFENHNKMTSDLYFQHLDPAKKFDLIFVDGLHEHDQTLRDILNSLKHMNPGGTILVHDVDPPTEWHARELPTGGGEWLGNTWISFAKLRCTRQDLSMAVIDCDWGVGIIQEGEQKPFSYDGAIEGMPYSFFEANRQTLMNIISVDEFRDGPWGSASKRVAAA